MADTENDGDFLYLLAGPDLRISYEKSTGAKLYLLLSGGYAYTERRSFEIGDSEVPPVQENNLYTMSLENSI